MFLKNLIANIFLYANISEVNIDAITANNKQLLPSMDVNIQNC